MHVSGIDEFKRYEGYRSTSCYLRSATHSSLPTILASSISLRLQCHSTGIDVGIQKFYFIFQKLLQICAYDIHICTYIPRNLAAFKYTYFTIIDYYVNIIYSSQSYH